jgi:hypothetical protein
VHACGKGACGRSPAASLKTPQLQPGSPGGRSSKSELVREGLEEVEEHEEEESILESHGLNQTGLIMLDFGLQLTVLSLDGSCTCQWLSVVLSHPLLKLQEKSFKILQMIIGW